MTKKTAAAKEATTEALEEAVIASDIEQARQAIDSWAEANGHAGRPLHDIRDFVPHELLDALAKAEQEAAAAASEAAHAEIAQADEASED